MSNHTPGPWSVANVGWVSSVTTHQTVCAMYAVKSGSDHSKSNANSRLIAAAPELLEALREMLRLANAEGWEGFQKARAAIEKATGEKA